MADLSVQQTEVVHGLLRAALAAHIWLAAQWTDQVLDAPLLYGGREVGLEAALAEGTRTMSHGCDLCRRDVWGRHLGTLLPPQMN